MIPALFVSIAVSFVFGFLFLRTIWPAEGRPVLLMTLMAFPAGWSLTSAMFFFWLVVSGGQSRLYPYAEIALLVLLLGLATHRFRKRKKSEHSGPGCKWRLDLYSALSGLSLLVPGSFCFYVSHRLAWINPWGYWDAWARINVKSRFLFAGGEHWRWIFKSKGIAHHDYPLLIQCAVARTWTWIGDIVLIVPQVWSVTWGVFSLLLLLGSVKWLRATMTATIVGLAYLTYTPLLFWAAMQYADIPLACYMVLACVMMVAAERSGGENGHFLFLAGYFAGAAAWCKNEGIAFAALIALWALVLLLRRSSSSCRKAVLSFCAGSASIGSAVLILKLGFADDTDVLSAQPHSVKSIGAAIGSGEHHLVILKYFWEHLPLYWRGWPLLALAIAFLLHLGRRSRRIGSWAPLFCVVAMGGFYYEIFLTTPYDLQWHLGTAMDRLILQVWPVFLLGLAVLFEEKNGDAAIK